MAADSRELSAATPPVAAPPRSFLTREANCGAVEVNEVERFKKEIGFELPCLS
jgi:hypothetical protein